jgi:hypothetical protein
MDGFASLAMTGKLNCELLKSVSRNRRLVALVGLT